MQPPSVEAPSQSPEVLPDHTQLPDSDGAIVENFQEQPQNTLLTGSLTPRLWELHPNGQYCIGCDSGIYWRYTQPPLNGCKSPDWFYIPNVPPMLDGQLRRSYVLWQEVVRPLVIAEYVSGDGSEERDTTPYRGKFWVYEQAIGAAYYAIFDSVRVILELHKLNGGKYHRVEPNAVGRLPIEPLGVELGIWHGTIANMTLPWLRVWDSATGQLMPSTEEREAAAKQRAEAAEALIDDTRRRLEEETERAESERRRAESERQRAEKLAERMRAMGLDPDAP